MEKEESQSKFKNRQSSSLTYALHWKQKAKQGKEIIRLEENLTRINILENDRVLKTVKGILNKLTPEKYDLLKGQLIDSGITSADILKDVITLIFDKAVFEPTFCPMCAELCSDINDKLPTFPPAKPGDKEITFKRVLLNICQEAFECAPTLREELRQMSAPGQEAERNDKEKWLKLMTLGNLCLIGQLLKQKMVPEKIVHHIVKKLLGVDKKVCPAEENVEALCHLFKTIGQHLDGNINSKRINDAYFRRLQDLSKNPQLELRLRFMVQNIIDLRSNGWILRREERKVKAHIEIHYEAEKNLGTQPAIANNETSGADNDIWEVPRTGLMCRRDGPGPQHSPVMSISKEEAAEEKNWIWPPTQKIRDAISNRLFETLSSKSLSYEEANSVAKTIEEEAYSVASNAVSSEDDGIENLLVYAKDINKRMLVTVKDRSI